MLVASSTLCFQSSLRTLANAPRTVSEMKQNLDDHQHVTPLLLSYQTQNLDTPSPTSLSFLMAGFQRYPTFKVQHCSQGLFGDGTKTQSNLVIQAQTLRGNMQENCN